MNDLSEFVAQLIYYITTYFFLVNSFQVIKNLFKNYF